MTTEQGGAGTDRLRGERDELEVQVVRLRDQTRRAREILRGPTAHTLQNRMFNAIDEALNVLEEPDA